MAVAVHLRPNHFDFGLRLGDGGPVEVYPGECVEENPRYTMTTQARAVVAAWLAKRGGYPGALVPGPGYLPGAGGYDDQEAKLLEGIEYCEASAARFLAYVKTLEKEGGVAE